MTQYQYNSTDLVRPTDLSERETFLLRDSKTFCIYPWIHLHAYPTGEAYPCCHAEMQYPVGNCKKQSLEQIWQGSAMASLRKDMLSETPNPACQRCYEQEESGFFSGRRSANKHHGHHIKKLESNPFEMTYWDIRFSNLCNLSCRSCGHIFSSSWYQDQVKLAGEDWARNNKPLNIAGRTREDMWEQLLPHIDYVEQIYFAGGEPLMMDEHYRILEELEARERFDVRLIYNTNFTQVKLKDRYVFDYWRKFKSVAVGASLDAMGSRAGYIRHGTDWAVVEDNRRRMIDTCPNVDFYISPTLSIMNAWHLPDFHREWVEQGLIRAQDLNVNILQDPAHYRIDIAPIKFKQRLRIRYEEHLAWLRPHDPLKRATVGFESAINFMMSTNNQTLLPRFREKTAQLDKIRGESLLLTIPELECLYYDRDTA
jgi:radical SAM protein with 4Fe4S-binding SPASM domain